MRSRFHVVQNAQVGCYASHFDLKLTIYSSGLPTAFHYLLPQDSPLRFVIIISSLPLQQIIIPQTPHQVEHGTESSKTMGASSDTSCPGTQPQCRHHLTHRDATNPATGNMTLDAPLKMVCKTGSTNSKKQHAIGCEYS